MRRKFAVESQRDFFGNIVTQPSISLLIIEILHMTGELPYRSLKFVGKTANSVQKAVQRLTNEGYIKIEMVNRSRVILLDRLAYDEYGENLFIGAENMYQQVVKETYHSISTNITTRSKRDSATRRERNMRTAEALVFMRRASVAVLPNEKPFLEENALKGTEICFYTAREVKRYLLANDVRGINGRAIGYFINKDSYYSVYFQDKKPQTITQSIEYHTRAAIEEELNRCSDYFTRTGKRSLIEQAIILTSNYELLNAFIGNRKSAKYDERKLFALDSTHRKNHLIPYEIYGCQILRMIHMSEEILRLLPFQKEEVLVGTTDVDCDGIRSDGTYVCVFLDCELRKLQNFIIAIEFNQRSKENKTFEIICYDFQEEYIKKAIKDKTVKIKTLSVNDVIGEFLERWESCNNEES